MGVVNLRDAIILSLLKEGLKSRGDIESTLDVQKSTAKQSLTFLNGSGYITKRRTAGGEFYLITESGRTAIDRIYKRLSLD